MYKNLKDTEGNLGCFKMSQWTVLVFHPDREVSV